MKNIKILIILIVYFFIHGCVEPIIIDESLKFENAIVIEATITNEFKYQEIFLSNSYNFDNEPVAETNANVKVVDDEQNTYLFQENSPGKYISVNKFSAQPNKNYQLLITTSDGKLYSSQSVQLPNIIQIDEVYASKETDSKGNEGISIFVDSHDPTGNSRYYRYEYEETYKIIAPKWIPIDIVIANTPPYNVSFVPKTKEERVCFNTLYSNSIIQTETNDLSEDRVSKFKIRSISNDDAIISHRYSILVKQYVQSLEAYSYHKTLNKLSGSESLLLQNQPGFINGNVFSEDDKNEKVLGFFEISSVSTQRYFFNFSDFFPNESLPPYFVECEDFAPSTTFHAGEPSALLEMLNTGEIKYYRDNPNFPNPQNEEEGRYSVVRAPCGDCTKLGSNIVPEFWIE